MTKDENFQMIKFSGQALKVVSQFKYLELIISEEASRGEIRSRAVQTMTAVAKLKKHLERKDHLLEIKKKLDCCVHWPESFCTPTNHRH